MFSLFIYYVIFFFQVPFFVFFGYHFCILKNILMWNSCIGIFETCFHHAPNGVNLAFLRDILFKFCYYFDRFNTKSNIKKSKKNIRLFSGKVDFNGVVCLFIEGPHFRYLEKNKQIEWPNFRADQPSKSRIQSLIVSYVKAQQLPFLILELFFVT